MKLISIILITLIILIFSIFTNACAMGPIMVTPHTAQWDREVDTKVTGYYVYWRLSGTNIWINTQRSIIVSQPITGESVSYDLLQLNLVNNIYDITVTATDSPGNESGPSNIAAYTVYIPSNPASLITK